jgi:CRISPR system Cascade subunit CasE
MYLSRLILNPRARRVQREIAEPYQMHRSIMRAFPDDLDDGQERVLFRLEPGRRSGVPTLLIQSWTLPDWTWLAEPGARRYLLPVDVDNPAVKRFELDVAAGQVLAFRLRANPTVKRTVDGKKKRLGLYREEEQRDWLRRKAEASGFRPGAFQVHAGADVGGWLRRDGEAHHLKLLAVRFEGLLQVTDPERLREAVRSGIGSGKGLGFGLLSLARPRAS